MSFNAGILCRLVFAIVCWGTASPAPTADPIPTNTDFVAFDAGHAHRFFGLGVQIFSEPDFVQTRDLVMTGLNIKWIRTTIGASFQEDDFVDTGMSVDDILAQLPDHPNLTASQHLTLAQLSAIQYIDQIVATRYNIMAREISGKKIHAIVMSPPHRWLTQFQWFGQTVNILMYGQGGGPDHRQDYVNLVVAQVIYSISAGIVPDVLEFISEPNTYTANIPSQVYNDMVAMVRNTLDLYGLTFIGIEGPGSSTTATAVDPTYMSTLQGAVGNAADLVAYSVHDYDTYSVPEPAGLSAVFLASISAPKPIYVTELGVIAPRWSSPPYVYGPLSGPTTGTSPDNAVNHAEYGVAVAGEVLKALGDGAEGVSLWTLNDMAWLPNTLGLIDLAGNVRPAVPALESFLAYVPPSASCTAYRGVTTSLDLSATAFACQGSGMGTFVVAVANTGSYERAIRLGFGRLAAIGTVDVPRLAIVAGYGSSTPAKLSLTPEGRAIHIMVAANSVTVISDAQPR
jgi:hypothetical protein